MIYISLIYKYIVIKALSWRKQQCSNPLMETLVRSPTSWARSSERLDFDLERGELDLRGEKSGLLNISRLDKTRSYLVDEGRNLADPGRGGDVQPVRGGGHQVGLQDGRAETEPLLLLVLQCKVEAQTENI